MRQVGRVEEQVVPFEHLVVEADVVEADDQIGTFELLDERGSLVLGVDAVLVQHRAEGTGHRDAHLVLVAPATDVIGRAACFQVEINDVSGHDRGAWRSTQPMR